MLRAIRVALCMKLVVEMRDLEYGATNTSALQSRWRIRRAADENEPAWLDKFHHDPRCVGPGYLSLGRALHP